MKYIELDTYDKLSEVASELISYEIKNNPSLVLGLATGSSPVGIYQNLIKKYKNGEISFKNIKTFNLDEYLGLDSDNNQSYRYFMQKNLFDQIDINSENINFLNGVCIDADEECSRYDKLIDNIGIDVQVLGIGINGHIAFNEPSDSFAKTTHVVKLAEKTIQANSRFFNHISEVPTKALTMGIKQIFKSKKIILVANGKNKKDAIEKMLKGEITPNMPASILQLHSDCTVIYSKE